MKFTAMFWARAMACSLVNCLFILLAWLLLGVAINWVGGFLLGYQATLVAFAWHRRAQ